MKISLLHIEQSVKDFFENRLVSASDQDELFGLTHQLIKAVEESVFLLNGKTIAASVYEIRISPTYLSKLDEIEQWKEKVVELIQSILKENELEILRPISIIIQWEENDADMFSIRSMRPNLKSGTTIRIRPDNNVENQEKTYPNRFGTLIFDNGEEFAIVKASTSIGREHDNDLQIDNLLVSRHHAKIMVNDEYVTLVDLKSLKGTTVNGNRIQKHFLSSGDVIELGDIKMVFVLEEKTTPELATVTQKI